MENNFFPLIHGDVYLTVFLITIIVRALGLGNIILIYIVEGIAGRNCTLSGGLVYREVVVYRTNGVRLCINATVIGGYLQRLTNITCISVICNIFYAKFRCQGDDTGIYIAIR